MRADPLCRKSVVNLSYTSHLKGLNQDVALKKLSTGKLWRSNESAKGSMLCLPFTPTKLE